MLPDPVPVDQMMFVVRMIRYCEAALASGHRVPCAARDAVTGEATELQAVARAAPRRAVLPVAVNEVGNLVVHGDVVDLRNGQVDVVPGGPAIHRNIHAPIVDHGHAIPVGGIDPHLVIVAAGIGGHLGERVTAIERRENDAEKKNTSFSLSGAISVRV